MSPSPRPDAALAAGLALALDACAADVVGALETAGIPSVLLRGPVLEDWLHEPASPRPYTDVDLLVRVRDLADSERIIEGLGFERLPLPPHDEHARTWVRTNDGATLDLHRSLSGISVDADAVWAAFTRDATKLRVSGREVVVPSVAARAFELALHVAQHGSQLNQPVQDLERALAQTDVETWAAAACLAVELDSAAEFAAGLRRLPAGSAVADRLKLPATRSVGIRLRSGSPPAMALGLDWLATRPGTQAKLTFAASKVLPPPEFMRAWSRTARRGRVGLGAAYVLRLGWIARHAPRAIWAWLRARREVRREEGR
jgi:hypothetical protein